MNYGKMIISILMFIILSTLTFANIGFTECKGNNFDYNLYLKKEVRYWGYTIKPFTLFSFKVLNITELEEGYEPLEVIEVKGLFEGYLTIQTSEKMYDFDRDGTFGTAISIRESYKNSVILHIRRDCIEDYAKWQ